MYKVTPVNQYWLFELLAELEVCNAPKANYFVKDGSVFTSNLKIIDLVNEVFSDTFFLIEEPEPAIT